ncbi:unnamed protein product [Phaedon cochleariae]|uniref:DNA-directed RNA polymerase n=1 Tax=Phaedon cochleariae TaxID=80249 RepID=A0A9N9WZL4_PHACE|nr:unnamed protein product [Phaedon cochleariae]
MHRLIQLSTSLPRSSHGSLNRILKTFDPSIQTCSLCKQSYLIGGQTRSQSTSISPNLKMKKLRKRKKTKKDYTELVVVTNNSSCQLKATVQKLTFSDLKLLASTNLNLSELYKLKELSKHTPVEEHTYNNLNIIENIPRTSQESKNDILSTDLSTDQNDQKQIIFDIPDSLGEKEMTSVFDNSYSLESQQEIASRINDHIIAAELESEMDIESLRRVNTFQPEVIEEHIPEPEEHKELPDKTTKTTLDYHRREEIMSKTLAAYIEVCAHMKNPMRGLGALNFHRFKTKKIENKSYVAIKSTNVYNALLKGFAHKGDFPKLQEIVKIMQEEQVKCNVQSYIAIFECLGKLTAKQNHSKDVEFYTKEALSNNITYDKIMNEGSFLNQEREFVLQAMRVYDPGYVPEYDKPDVWYNNHMVDHLNNKKQLEPLRSTGDNEGAVDELKKGIKKQLDMEQEGYVTIKSINNRGPITDEVTRHRTALQEHYAMWAEAALEAFQRDLATLSAQRSATNMEPYMRCIPAKDFVAIVVDEAKKIAQGSETYSPTVNMLYRELGNKVYTRYRILCKQKTGVLDKISDIHTAYCAAYVANRKTHDALPTEQVPVNPRQAWQWLEYEKLPHGATLQMDHQPWLPTTLQFVGKFLYHIVMYDLKVNVNAMRSNNKHVNHLPAFYTIFRTQGRLVKEEVKPHPILSKLYRHSLPETLTFPAWEVPMLCPPVPWVSTETGGYLASPCDVVRLPQQATAQRQRMAEAGTRQLYPSLDSLNQLAAVPWRVNRRILDTVLQVFNDGGSSRLDVPEPPSSLTPPSQPTNEMDKAERYQLFRQRMQYRRKKAEMYSLWCDCLYRLSLANHFRDDVFWLPHNMDFRGRVYPVPPHLNHLGSDLARSMLVFAESRPLGPDGLDWLKIHLINLTGLKKRDPISERLKYANEHMDVILDSADNPLTGYRWWSKSDEPWQTLACCMEIADVVRSPDPENYRSHFPIHQDGSCNGLQHYAALGRDSGGAFSVNLAPSVVPQDVYSAVVALVEQQRAKDAENGHEIAKILEGFVVRKVIKQTVMTTVYGVTRFGARLQIVRQLKDIDSFPKESVWAASSYLTGRTFDSLRTMFTSTREIQDWFTECARLISAVGCRHVEWVTPLGLPVVQPYFKYKKQSIGPTYESFAMDKYEKPNVMKQKNAFPPNFIHSLDSNHMMLTSLHCERAGITFVSVHDCYWTHPSTVQIMNKICREQFVALHSQPILEDLSAFMSDKYSYHQSDFAGDGSLADATRKKLNRILRQLPKTGSFDITKVLDSVYFFS